MSDVLIRPMRQEDLPRLQELSPPSVKPFVHFLVYMTLVAEIDGVVAGYTQFSLTPDGTLHSLAIRIGKAWKGRGIGRQLLEEKVTLARDAGARLHMYAVDPVGEVALKKILEGIGMHVCQKRPGMWLYVQDLTPIEADTWEGGR